MPQRSLLNVAPVMLLLSAVAVLPAGHARAEADGYSAKELDRTMVRVPGGPFEFGLTEQQKERIAERAGVHPDQLHFHSEHEVLTTQPFWIDKYPVTRGQFLRFMKATGYEIPRNGWLVGWTDLVDGPFTEGDKRSWPMIGVNAKDARAYAEWVGKRLPIEIEWEKAARGTDGRLYPWGDQWDSKACYRNPGNIPLGAGFPVGSFPKGASPYGAVGMSGSALQWVRTVFTPVSKSGNRDGTRYFLAGSSPVHAKRYTHMATSRFSWHHSMRIYNSGFRCVSDERPENLVEDPSYEPPEPRMPEPVSVRKDLYRKESIRLEPTNHATIKIHVPWFPKSVWALDCPESPWGPFGGANTWPSGEKDRWHVDWNVEDNGRRVSYHRKKGDKSLKFEAWVDGPSVEYRISGENIGQMNLANLCMKTFSPLFSSQERLTQHRLTGDGLASCARMPIAEKTPASFGWSLGGPLENGAAIYQSYGGSAYMVDVAQPGVVASGNGWVPCTHMGGPQQLIDDHGGGRLVFVIGSLDRAKPYMDYPAEKVE